MSTSNSESVALNPTVDTEVIGPRYQPQKACKRQRCAQIVVPLVLFLSIVVNLGLVAYIVYLLVSPSAPKEVGPHTQALSSQRLSPSAVCVPCRSAGIEPEILESLDETVYVVETATERLCCQEGTESLQFLVKMILMENRTLTPTTSDFSSSSRPSAHLFLEEKSVRGDQLLWTQLIGYGVAHVTGNVVYRTDSGRLYVPSDGLYFVYTGVTLKVREQLSATVDIVHCLYRHPASSGDKSPNRTREDKLLLLLRKSSLPREAETFANSFLSGALRLRKSDELSVHLSNTSLVYDFWASSYFGLFKISD